VLSAREEDDLKDEKTVIALLRSSKVLEPDFDYAAFDAIVDKAAKEEMPGYDYSGMLRDLRRS